MHLPFNLTMSILVIQPEDKSVTVQKKLYKNLDTRLFIVPFVTATYRKEPKCPYIEDRLNKL